MTTYNGWTSWTEWNCSLWIGNDEGLYRFVRGLVHSGVTEWSEVAKLLTINFGNSCTPDGAVWSQANAEEMNEMLLEL